MTKCPDCHSIMNEYKSKGWLEWICWDCGHYSSNSPTFKLSPSLFENMVRKNPDYFIKKFLLGLSDDGLQGDKSDEELTES